MTVRNSLGEQAGTRLFTLISVGGSKECQSSFEGTDYNTSREKENEGAGWLLDVGACMNT